MTDQPTPATKPNYPYPDGDVTVLGPEIFASADGQVICWRGENYVRQGEVAPLRAELKPWQLLGDQPDEPLPQTERFVGGHRFTALPVDPEAERAATERAVQAAADSKRAAEWLAAHSGPTAAENRLTATLREVLNAFTTVRRDDGVIAGHLLEGAIHPDDMNRWRAALDQPQEQPRV